MPLGSPKRTLQSFFQNSNMRLILICFAITVYGCLLVYSASHGYGYGFKGASTHIIASIIGFIAALFISQADYDDICALWPVWAGISLLLMILTFTPLGLNAAGTDDTAWLGLGSVTFQPSELMKIAFIITFGVHLSRVEGNIHSFKTVLLLGLHALVPIILVFLQGDDGTAIVFIMIFLSMLFVSGINPLYYIVGLTGLCVGVPLLWSTMSEDKKARILCIIPGYIEEHLQGAGWQQFEALKAIGSGQLTGTGYLNTTNGSLFARNNDLIFTVAGEELGFVGGLLLLALIVLLLYELFRCARQARDSLGTYLCVGMLALIGFQSIINLGMNLRLLPVIGITLPFFSSGGSSVATLYLGIGLVLSVSFSQSTRKKRSLLL